MHLAAPGLSVCVCVEFDRVGSVGTASTMMALTNAGV